MVVERDADDLEVMEGDEGEPEVGRHRDVGREMLQTAIEDVKRAAIVTVGSWLDRAVAEYAAVGDTDPRLLRPSSSASWAIPPAAWSLLWHLERFPRGV